jgi:FMN phosphatase YigB (HAD superfamily)
MLVLSERLDGYDTFLTGTLELQGERFNVRIFTLDDVTVLRLDRKPAWQVLREWTGTLHLPHGARPLTPPTDLTELARNRQRDLTALDEAELRYALTFLGESTSDEIRLQRTMLIVDALPNLMSSGVCPRPLVSLDVGGTLGNSSSPGLAQAIAAAAPMPSVDVYRHLRTTLYVAPVITESLIERICSAVGIRREQFPEPRQSQSDFLPAQGSVGAVRELSFLGTVVTLSNVIASEADLPSLSSMYSPWLTASFRSCDIGYSKPSPEAFQFVAGEMGVAIDQMIHVGDDWECDVQGAISAGARAIWIANGRPHATDSKGVDDRLVVVQELADVPEIVAELTREPQ